MVLSAQPRAKEAKTDLLTLMPTDSSSAGNPRFNHLGIDLALPSPALEDFPSWLSFLMGIHFRFQIELQGDYSIGVHTLAGFSGIHFYFSITKKKVEAKKA